MNQARMILKKWSFHNLETLDICGLVSREENTQQDFHKGAEKQNL